MIATLSAAADASASSKPLDLRSRLCQSPARLRRKVFAMEESTDPIFAIETVWIREWARTYLPSESSLTYSAELFRKNSINLVDLRNILRSGRVVLSEKLDDPGAEWIVEGDDGEGNLFRVCLVVISETMDVTIHKIKRLNELEANGDAA